jgi:hypothetical protein
MLVKWIDKCQNNETMSKILQVVIEKQISSSLSVPYVVPQGPSQEM